MTVKGGEADTALQQARAKAETKDFVGASDQMKAVQTATDALDKLAKDPQRVKFLADRKAAEEVVNAAGDERSANPPVARASFAESTIT